MLIGAPSRTIPLSLVMGNADGKELGCGGVFGQSTHLGMLSDRPKVDDAVSTRRSAWDSASVGPRRMQSSRYHSCFIDGMDVRCSVMLIKDLGDLLVGLPWKRRGGKTERGD